MKRLAGLLAVIFIASVSQVFAQEQEQKQMNVGDPGPAGGVIASVDAATQEYIEAKKLPDTYTWREAKKACKNLTEGKYSDWVLPKKEILSLIYENLAKGKEDLGGFKTNCGSPYWSSSNDTGAVCWRSAWAQLFEDDGNQSGHCKGDTFYVICVRHGSFN